MKNSLYPLKFQPILKEKIWGGQKLRRYLNKSSNSEKLGESWEVSAVSDNVSIISNGELKGQTLKQVLENFKSELLGAKNFKRFGDEFPLLIKFIDAKDDLSIQLHPNDKLAKKRHNSFGKTEMWYVMQANENANLIVGFNQKMDKATYLEHLEKKQLADVLNFDRVKEGDAYFIEAGRVHTIGAGVLLAEIQQTSDITYRIYDWDRVDEDGNKRALHNDKAIGAINFNLKDNFRINYDKEKNRTNKMVSSPFFTTNYIELDSDINKDNNLDSFIIYICVDGKVEVSIDCFNEQISKGETILIPATIKNFKLKTKNAKLLEVYL